MSRDVAEYVGWLHALKDRMKEGWTQFWHSQTEAKKETNFRNKVKAKLENLSQRTITRINHSSNTDDGDYSHLTRSKTRTELVKISAAVMGIEFSYAAETAFVSPLLLNIGLRHRHMTLMWCLSPLLGFFVTPLLGSLSDGCRSRLGKRRPFIILLSIGIVLGLILVPNGKAIGRLLGDTYKENRVIAAGQSPSLSLSSSSSLTTSEAGIESNFTPTTRMRTEEKRFPSSNDDKTSGSSSSSYRRNSLSLNPIEEDPSIVQNFPPSYKQSPRHWILDESGRMRNYYSQVDEIEQQDVLKNFKRNPLSKQKENSLENQFKEVIFEMQESNTKSSTDDNDTSSSSGSSSSNNSNQFPGSSQTEDFKSIFKNTDNHNNTSNNENEKDMPTTTMTTKTNHPDSIANHPWGLIFTIIGTVLLDFDADACQSPSRAYMLDVTLPEDHARGLSTFTIMAGLGGSMGYVLGAVNWENTFIGTLFGGQVRAVFTLVLFIFIGCVITTIRSFKEIPIDRLWTNKPSDRDVGTTDYARFEEDKNVEGTTAVDYGTIAQQQQQQETSFNENRDSNFRIPPPPLATIEGTPPETIPTFREYVKTTVQLPKSLQWLSLTNYFSWMSLVCYSLYFTDFVGEAVYGGDPTAPIGSISRKNYEDGVRFGCWGMSLYSLSCSIYSFGIEKLVHRFGAKRVYICGQLVYSVGMVLMAIFRHPAGVLIFSWTAGIQYATLFTMPYLLVARYHAAETFDADELVRKPSLMRGLGTDIAIVSSMVFLAQMTQALTLGSVVAAAGTTTAIVCAAAVFASCGALSATQVLYLDL